jgi:hypothetical protein
VFEKRKFELNESAALLMYPGRSCPAREAKRLFPNGQKQKLQRQEKKRRN